MLLESYDIHCTRREIRANFAGYLIEIVLAAPLLRPEGPFHQVGDNSFFVEVGHVKPSRGETGLGQLGKFFDSLDEGRRVSCSDTKPSDF